MIDDAAWQPLPGRSSDAPMRHLALPFLIAASLAACAHEPGPTNTAGRLPPEVTGTTWQWVSMIARIGELRPDAPEHYTIRFGDDNRAQIRADCNTGSAPIGVGDNRQLPDRSTDQDDPDGVSVGVARPRLPHQPRPCALVVAEGRTALHARCRRWQFAHVPARDESVMSGRFEQAEFDSRLD